LDFEWALGGYCFGPIAGQQENEKEIVAV